MKMQNDDMVTNEEAAATEETATNGSPDSSDAPGKAEEVGAKAEGLAQAAEDAADSALLKKCREYEKKIGEQKKAIERYEGQLESLERQLEEQKEANRQLNSRQEELQRAQAELAQARRDLQDVRARAEQARGDAEKAQSDLEAAQEELQKSWGELDEERAAHAETERKFRSALKDLEEEKAKTKQAGYDREDALDELEQTKKALSEMEQTVDARKLLDFWGAPLAKIFNLAYGGEVDPAELQAAVVWLKNQAKNLNIDFLYHMPYSEYDEEKDGPYVILPPTDSASDRKRYRSYKMGFRFAKGGLIRENLEEVAAPEQQAKAPKQQARTPEQQAKAPEQQAKAPEQQAKAPEQQAKAPEQQAKAPEQQAKAPEQQVKRPRLTYLLERGVDFDFFQKNDGKIYVKFYSNAIKDISIKVSECDMFGNTKYRYVPISWISQEYCLGHLYRFEHTYSSDNNKKLYLAMKNPETPSVIEYYEVTSLWFTVHENGYGVNELIMACCCKVPVMQSNYRVTYQSTTCPIKLAKID